MSKILIHEDNFSDSSDCEIDEDVEGYLVVKESYCMACDSPLKSYHSLICSECLHDKAKELSQMVDDLNEDIKKYVFIDPDYSDSGIEIYFDNKEFSPSHQAVGH